MADDFYHLYAVDIAAMQLLGVKHFRFSISWSRVIPDGDGAINQKGLDFYASLLDALHAAGIEPIVCLYHWDLPQVTRLIYRPAHKSMHLCCPQQYKLLESILACCLWIAAYKGVGHAAFSEQARKWCTVRSMFWRKRYSACRRWSPSLAAGPMTRLCQHLSSTPKWSFRL